MMQAMILSAIVGLTFLGAFLIFGYEVTYLLGYGALSIMAVMISATFLMLWLRRATPLALGMAFSWAGAACLLGWWWSYKLLERPGFMAENAVLFAFLSLYVVGALLHFSVMQVSFGMARGSFLAPVALSVLVSALAQYLV